MTICSFIIPLSNLKKPSRRRDGLIRCCETAMRKCKFVAFGCCDYIYRNRYTQPSEHRCKGIFEVEIKKNYPEAEISQKKLPVCLILAHYNFIFAPVNAP